MIQPHAIPIVFGDIITPFVKPIAAASRQLIPIPFMVEQFFSDAVHVLREPVADW